MPSRDMLSRIERYEVSARGMYGPETLSVSCEVSPQVHSLAGAFAGAVESVTHRLNDMIRRRHAGIADDGIEECESGIRLIRNPDANPGQLLSDEEEKDMDRCLHTYAGNGFQWIQKNVRNYTSGNNWQTDHEPASMLKHGMRLAYLKRVTHINPDSWNMPPLFIPTVFGCEMFMRQEQSRLSVLMPPQWLFDLSKKLVEHGIGRAGVVAAVNEARAILRMEAWV